MIDILLKKGREKPVLKDHPWIFSGAVSGMTGEPASGDIVRVLDYKGAFLAFAHFSASSEIRLRVLDRNEKAVIDERWFMERMKKAVALRETISGTNAQRLIFSESDFLPGLIVDRYGDYCVIQTLTPGMEREKTALARMLRSLVSVKSVYEKNDAEAREREGLPRVSSVLSGDPLPGEIVIRENGLEFKVNVHSGQKTGFFLDQRQNRPLVASYAEGRDVLDVFSYTGGFAVHCLKRGAKSVLRIDSSAEALGLGGENIRLNSLDPALSPSLEGNAFEILRKMRDEKRKFGLIILDPPKLAPTQAHVPKALRAYKDITLLALKLLLPQGILAVFSCSGGVDTASFRKMILWASEDADCELLLLHQLHQAADHPVRLFFPESEYLKGIIARIG